MTSAVHDAPDAFDASEPSVVRLPAPGRRAGTRIVLPAARPGTPIVDQAAGVLVFRYSIAADAAYDLLQRWASDAEVGVEAVARALVLDICQGAAGTGSDPRLVRWLEERLRHEVTAVVSTFPGVRATPVDAEQGAPAPVVVAVDHSEVSLDAVVEATRRAARRGVPLHITVDDAAAVGDPAHLRRRVELAAELARALEPGVEVLLPGLPADG